MVPEKFISGELETIDLILSDKSIYENLVYAKDNRLLISVRQGQRVIGKTTALIKFAKENGYTVLVGNNAIAKMLAKHFKYNNIRSINSSALDGLGGIVVDECCPVHLVQKLLDHGQLLVTGFVKRGN